MSHPILLFDGVCGLCNRSTQFVLRYDHQSIFRFAALQSDFAAPILARHGANPADLDTMYLVLNYNDPAESLLARSDAVLHILHELGGLWRACGFACRLFPRPLRDFGYRLIARNRYRLFGRYDTCPLPTEETRARFLDQ